MSDIGINYCTIRINDKKCTRCHTCIHTCPTTALRLDKGIFTHNAYECSYCHKCMDACEKQAIKILEM